MPRDLRLSPSPERYLAGTVLTTQRDGAAVKTAIALPHRADADSAARVRVGGGYQLGGSGGMAAQSASLEEQPWAAPESPGARVRQPESPYRSSTGQRREKMFDVAVKHDIETQRQTAGGEAEPVSRVRVGGGYEGVSPGGPHPRSPRPEMDDGEREVRNVAPDRGGVARRTGVQKGGWGPPPPRDGETRRSPSRHTAVHTEIVTVRRHHDDDAKAKALGGNTPEERYIARGKDAAPGRGPPGYRERTKAEQKSLNEWDAATQPRELRPGEQEHHVAVRRGGGYRAEEAEQAQRRQRKQQQQRSELVHHDGSPRRGSPRGDVKQQAHRSQEVTLKPLQSDSADIEEGTEFHKLVEGTETSYATSRAGAVRTSIQRPHQCEPMYRVGGGYEIGPRDEHAMDDQIHELHSPSRHSPNTSLQAHRKERSTTSKNPKKTKRKAARVANSDDLCRSPFDTVKIVMWLLLVHCFLEIWGMLFAFRDWFRCNFYPEYTDLMWDIICCTFVAMTAGFVVASTVGCDCICDTVVRLSDKVATRGSNWPKYLYTIACITALVIAMFGDHQAVVSNDPYGEELSVIRGAADAPGSVPEGSGINEGRRRSQGQDQEEEEEPCTEETDDEPIAWCVSSESGVTLENAAAATNECTDVMKYAGCSGDTRDASCAETMPYATFHMQAEAGVAQNECILNSANQLCKYEFSRTRTTVACPPPPPPPPTHGYAIVRCVESVWTARVLIGATICRTIGAIGATLVSCAVLITTPVQYVAPGPNRTTVADDIELKVFDSANETIKIGDVSRKILNNDERRSRAELQPRGAGGGRGGGPASPSLSPIQHNNTQEHFMTPAHV